MGGKAVQRVSKNLMEHRGSADPLFFISFNVDMIIPFFCGRRRMLRRTTTSTFKAPKFDGLLLFFVLFCCIRLFCSVLLLPKSLSLVPTRRLLHYRSDGNTSLWGARILIRSAISVIPSRTCECYYWLAATR